MRVVGSLTTTVKRIYYIEPVLVEILKQPIDLLYVNIPYYSRKGQKYIIPEDLKIFMHSSRIKLVRCIDYGPITKLIPAIMHEHDPNTIIITFDDDVYPLKDAVKNIIEGSGKYPHSALGYSGVCWGRFPCYYQSTRDLLSDQDVDWIEGVFCGAYRRKFFDLDELLKFEQKELKDELSSNDDHWISGYLAKKGINRKTLGYDSKEYFKYAPQKTIDPLCGRSGRLLYEHFRIISCFCKKGWYGISFSANKSIGFYVIIVVILIILLSLTF